MLEISLLKEPFINRTRIYFRPFVDVDGKKVVERRAHASTFVGIVKRVREN